MKVAALFTCFNRKEKTEKAIRTLVNGNPGIHFSFIITDDNSNDGTPDMLQRLKEEGYDIECIHGTGNMFYSGGMRVAMEWLLEKSATEFSYVLLMNDDVEFKQGAIEKLAAQSCKKKDAVIVGVTCDNDGQYSYGAIRYIKGITYTGVGIEYSDRECDTFNANCVLIPWKYFQKSGGMDSHYIHSLGDFDFGLTLKKNGAKIYPSKEYVGVCNPNSSKNSWRDTSISRLQRLKKKESPKGLPAGIWFYFIKKNFGVLLAIKKTITPYIRIMLGK